MVLLTNIMSDPEWIDWSIEEVDQSVLILIYRISAVTYEAPPIACDVGWVDICEHFT